MKIILAAYLAFMFACNTDLPQKQEPVTFTRITLEGLLKEYPTGGMLFVGGSTGMDTVEVRTTTYFEQRARKEHVVTKYTGVNREGARYFIITSQD